MLGNNLLFTFTITLVIFTLVAENEVHAAPEPCKELLDLMMKPEKIKKPKEDEIDKDDKHKRKKENIKQLKKVLEMIMHRKPKESEEVEIVKPKGVMEEMMTSYLNFLKYLMQF